MNIAYQRALILHEAGSYADAEWQLRESLEIKPGFEHARAMLAVCLVQQGKFAAAREAAERAIANDPTRAFAYSGASLIAAQAIPIGQAVGHGSTVMWAFFAIEIAMTFFFVALSRYVQRRIIESSA